MRCASAVLLCAVLLGGCKQELPIVSASDAPRSVVWTSLQSLAHSNVIRLPGIIAARREISIGFLQSGRLISRDVTVGQLVTRGSRLASIDPVSFQFAQLAAEADLSNAQVQLRNAIAEQSRYATLVKSDVTTQVKLDTATSARNAAKALVDQSTARLANVTDQLNNTVLKAEFDGVIIDALLDVGETAALGQTVLVLADPAEREAIIDIPDSIADEVQPGTAVRVYLELDKSVNVLGTVRLVAPSIDSATQSYRVNIQLLDPPDTFRLGSTVIAELSKTGTPLLEVPASLVQVRAEQHAIWLYNETQKSVSSTLVEVQGSRDGWLSILTDIDPQSVIVAAGVNRLEEGQIVELGQELRFE